MDLIGQDRKVVKYLPCLVLVPDCVAVNLKYVNKEKPKGCFHPKLSLPHVKYIGRPIMTWASGERHEVCIHGEVKLSTTVSVFHNKLYKKVPNKLLPKDKKVAFPCLSYQLFYHSRENIFICVMFMGFLTCSFQFNSPHSISIELGSGIWSFHIFHLNH